MSTANLRILVVEGEAAVAHAIAVRQTMMYWEIPTPDDVP